MKKKLIISIFVLSLNAGIFDFQEIEEANRFYNEEQYSDSVKHFKNISKIKNSNEANYDLANAEYKSGKFQEAINSYEKVVTKNSDLEFDKLYNMANSFVKLNDLKKAEEFYEKALKLKDDEDAKYNLELVKKIQEQQEQQKQDKDENKKDDKKDDKKQENRDKEEKKNENKKDDEKSKEEDKKNQEKQKNKEEKKDEKNQSEEDKKKDEKSDDKDEIKKGESQASEGKNMEEISDLEEKKWINRLNERKVKTLPYEDIKAKDEDVKSYW